MATIKELVIILMSSVLVNNVVFSKLMGTTPVFNANKKNKNAVMSLLVTAVMVVTTAIFWPLQTYVLTKLSLGYLQTVIFVIIIAVIAVLLQAVLKKCNCISNSLVVFVALNSAVLGLSISSVSAEYTFVQALVLALGTGLGFLVAMVVFGAIRSKLDESQIPTCFKGLPITIISAAIVSLALYAFAGVFENLLA